MSLPNMALPNMALPNMGCPIRQLFRGGPGAGLPQLAGHIEGDTMVDRLLVRGPADGADDGGGAADLVGDLRHSLLGHPS